MKIRPTVLIRDIAEQIVDIEEVSFVAITTGRYDLEININNDLLRLMHSRIHTIPGVYETSTTMYMEILKWASYRVKGASHFQSGDFVMTNKVKEEL